MAETATAMGVIGVGLGVPWLDPVAAAIVSLNIIHDGASNTRIAVADLMERTPMRTDRSGLDPLPQQLRAHVEGLPWVQEVEVRLREVGHVYFGEVFVVPRSNEGELPIKVRDAIDSAKRIDWRLHDLTITPLPDLSGLRRPSQ